MGVTVCCACPHYLCAEAPHVALLLVSLATANDTHQQVLSFGSLLQLFYLSSWSTLVLHNLELLGEPWLQWVTEGRGVRAGPGHA